MTDQYPEKCPHETFVTDVRMYRLSDIEGGAIIGYSAEIRIRCAICERRFQFLGLPAGSDSHGACVSIDGLEGRFAMCPEGEQPSTLDRLSAHFPPDKERQH